MITIYKKEMRTYFTNMVGYIFLAALLFLTGMWFTFDNVQMQHANFQNVLGSVTIFFFILIPTLTMRLFSEEIRQKTDQLLFTSPLTVAGIVLGKFFAAFSLFLIGTLITIALPDLGIQELGDDDIQGDCVPQLISVNHLLLAVLLL